MVLIARKAAGSASSAQLEKEWKWMLHKTGIMNQQHQLQKTVEEGDS